MSDLADLLHVALISHEDLAHTWVSKSLDLVHPLTNILKGVSIGHVIHYNDAMSSSIVAAGECAEPFLACSVPNLQLHNLLIKHYCLDFLILRLLREVTYKVYTNRVEKVLIKGIFLISGNHWLHNRNLDIGI